MANEDEGNPIDTSAPDDSPRPEPEPPPLEEPPDPLETKAKDDERLSKHVPLGLLFFAATGAVLIFLTIVAVVGYFAMSGGR